MIMNKENTFMIKHCEGCGIELQQTDERGVGYVTKSAFQKEYVYCKRCFDIRHYNKSNQVILEDRDYFEMLKLIERDALIILVVDLFDLSSTLNSAMHSILVNKDVLLAVNKVDLLMEDVNFEKLLMRVKKEYDDLGIDVIDGTFVSAKYNYEIDFFIEMIEKYRHNRNVYVIGVSNVGKSSFVMQLLKYYDLNIDITISEFPATTLKFLAYNLDDFTIYDTPGLINRGQMIHYVGVDAYNRLFPKFKIKPVTYQLYNNDNLFIDGLVQLKVFTKTRTSFICYFSEQTKFHRNKVNNLIEFYEKHCDSFLKPTYKEAKWKNYNLRVLKNHDIVISGYGFISVNQDVEIELVVHEGVQISLRKKLL